MKSQWEIKPETSWFEFNWKEFWSYRHLLGRLIRRDFLTLYQQTLLGPAWVIIQPLLTVATYIIIFDKVIEIPINDVPPVLFYLSGIILWNLFAETFTSTAFTFTSNAALFSKVYFPRLVIPFSVTASHLIRFFIQFGLFLVFYLYHVVTGSVNTPNGLALIAMPIVVAVVTLLGLGLGLCVSVFIAKYRDIGNLLQLSLRLLMFATPVFYPMSYVTNDQVQGLMKFNPLVPLIESFRYAFLGFGTFTIPHLLYSTFVALLIFLVGSLLFNRMGAKLIDVV